MAADTVHHLPDFLHAYKQGQPAPAPVLPNRAKNLLKRISEVNTPIPTNEFNEKSAAIKFMEEHEKGQQALMLLRDENTSLKAELAQRQNMIDLLTGENTQNKAKADLYMRYAATLSAQIKFVNDGLSQALQTAKEVTQAAQQAGMDMQLTDEDKTYLAEAFADTAPAQPAKT